MLSSPSEDLSADLASLRIDRGGRDEGSNRDPGGRPPRGVARWAAIAVVLAAASALIVLFIVPYIKAKVFKTEVEVTEISVISPAQASVELSTSGYVRPQRVSNVASKVDGRVSTVEVRQGQVVEEGATTR